MRLPGPNRRIVPFVAAGALAFALAPLPPAEEGYATLAAAAATAVLIGLATWLAPWVRLPSWVTVVPPLSYLVVVALLRDSQGGAVSGYGVLALLPVLWVALHGTRRQLLLVVAGVALTFTLPILLAGAPAYPGSEWRRAILLTAMSGLVGLAVQRLVGEIRANADAAARRTTELAAADERFRVAFECAPTGVALVDLDDGDRVLRANTPLATITGYSVEQLEATRLRSLTHPDDADLDAAQRADLVAGRLRAYDTEKRLITADRQVIWALFSVSALRDQDGLLRGIMHVQDISERKRFEGQLQYLADHDALTGLFNRGRLEAELDRVVAEARRYQRAGAILVLDLDHFKYVNDTLGHAAGDEVLGRIGDLLRRRVRVGDVLSRHGGDEFALVLGQADRAAAERVATELLGVIRTQEASATPRRALPVTATAGIALFDGGTEATGEELLIDAELALLDAKENGRGGLAVYDPSVAAPVRTVARLTWAERIRQALADDAFELYQQPIVKLSTGEVARHELLLRMRGDDGELIPPGAFLYVAERFGLIADIDRWVIGQAAQIAGRWDDPARAPKLEVNLSGLSLNDPALAGYIEDQLAAAGAAPARLTFEVTETAAIVNLQTARAFAERVKALGCGFALDDFGAGFGSFYYLKHLPFDTLKIDGDFVRDLPASRTDRLVIESIVGIARGLDTQTVAEWVEDEHTVDVLRTLGVDFGQGFHLGRPRPIPDAWRAAAPAP